MGREIRRVTPDWQHPTKPCDCMNGYRQRHSEYDLPGGLVYIPLYDRDYATARAEWIEGLARWEQGEVRDYKGGWKPKADYQLKYDFWEDDRPPTRELHRLAWTQEPTAYQVYETVSEGTPVSPVLATREALLDWLMNDGDGMGIEPRRLRLSREQAERFIEHGSAPSMIVSNGVVREGVIA